MAVKEDSDERSSYIKQLEKEVNDARVREIALKVRRIRLLVCKLTQNSDACASWKEKIKM